MYLPRRWSFWVSIVTLVDLSKAMAYRCYQCPSAVTSVHVGVGLISIRTPRRCQPLLRGRTNKAELNLNPVGFLKYFIRIFEPIGPQNNSNSLILSEKLQATHLCHLMLTGFALPIESRLLTNAVRLVTLYLGIKHPSAYLYPDTLLRWISFMPQLETLAIVIDAIDNPDANRVVEGQLAHTPIITPLTLPNLRYYRFGGSSTYLETLVYQITAPHLERLRINFSHLTFSVPRLLQFM